MKLTDDSANQPQEIISLLEQQELVEKSNYLSIAELELNGKKYRKVIQFAGNGKQRRELPAKYHVFENGKWKSLEDMKI